MMLDNKMLMRILMLFLFCYHGTCSATDCPTRGRFPNNVDTDCRGYTMCLSVGENSMKYDVLCPEHSIYSHLESQCTNVTSYRCLPHHNCTLEGDYANPSSDDCTSYIACVRDLNNIITARLIHCPTAQAFSATENICVNETQYKCISATDSPKVLQVSVNNSTTGGNFSLNNAMCLYTSYFVTIILCITFHVIINV